MKRKSQEGFLSEGLEELIRTRFGRRPAELIRLTDRWKTLVGERAWPHCRPAWIRRDVLWVFVDGSAWMQELNFLKPALLEQISRMQDISPITDIRWLQQPVEKERRAPAPPPDREPDPVARRSFADMTGIISDERCRSSLLNLWETFQKKQRTGQEQNPALPAHRKSDR